MLLLRATTAEKGEPVIFVEKYSQFYLAEHLLKNFAGVLKSS